MKRPSDTYGDNFPVVGGWDPRTPWRHAQALPGSRRTLAQIGWWSLVVILMSLVLLLAARDGFSEEPTPSDLVVTFQDGVVGYPEGEAHALSNRVEFRSASLRQLNARFGLVTVTRVISPAQPTASTFRLRFASQTGLDRALTAYRRNPHVRAAALYRSPAFALRPQHRAPPVSTLDA